MCLDLLLLSFQVGMLSQRGQLTGYARHWTSENVSGKETSKMLSTYVVSCISNTLNGENRVQNLVSLLGWGRSSTCLPLSGGFTRADALYILDILWKDRDSLMAIGASNLMPRCLSILFILWHHLLRMNK